MTYACNELWILIDPTLIFPSLEIKNDAVSEQFIS